MAIALALMSAVMYGVSDYIGGRASRRAPATYVALVAEVVLFAICLVVVPLIEDDPPPAAAVWWGLAAGVASSIGIVGLYEALSRGNMTVVAPVTGVVAAVIPVGVGVALGERPSALAVIGIGIAVVAVALIGGVTALVAEAAARPNIDGQTVWLALGVGVAFGMLFVAFARTGDDSGQWPVLFARFTSVPVIAAAYAVQRRGTRHARDRRIIVPAAAIAVLAAGSNVAYLVSTREGLLSVVSVVVAMYPASTILLASLIDGERATPAQLAGMGCAVVALVMITTGS